jgi:hypothetical protein
MVAILDSSMNLNQTLDLLRKKEKENDYFLRAALSLKRYRRRINCEILRTCDASCLPTITAKARIMWGRIFIQEIYRFFNLTDDENGPHEQSFFVTLADKLHVTTCQPQRINLQRIKRKLSANLRGLNYIGMIEPGYYNNIYDQSGGQQKDVVSWHGHFLVWDVTGKELAKHLAGIKSRFTPISPNRRAVHKIKIEPDQFGYKLWYMIKAPRREYSIGKRKNGNGKAGAPRFKQNSRDLRPGHRVKLFNLMRDMYLDRLAMAGGVGRHLLRNIKYEALRGYRRRNGWSDTRP